MPGPGRSWEYCPEVIILMLGRCPPCHMGTVMLVVTILKYFHIYFHISWQCPPTPQPPAFSSRTLLVLPIQQLRGECLAQQDPPGPYPVSGQCTY